MNATRSFKLFFVLLAFLGANIGSVSAQKMYAITGNSGIPQYTATGSSGTIAANKPIQSVINAIKADAAGADCTIMFGAGVGALDLGGGSSTLISFDGGASGTDWGLITLTGKATASNTKAVIELRNHASIDCKAAITGTGGLSGVISIPTTGTINLSAGGIVTSTGSGLDVITIVIGEGTLTVNGGTVQATGNDACAIDNANPNAVTNIISGTVSATTGTAIDNVSTGSTVNMSGGAVSATTGTAIANGFGAVNISGGTVQATTGIAVRNYYEGKITVSGTAQVTTSCISDGTITLDDTGPYTGVRLEITGGTVENTSTGMAVLNKSCGAIDISGGTVENTGQGHAIGIEGEKEVVINISGGTVRTTGTNGIAIHTTGENAKLNMVGGMVESEKYWAIFNESKNAEIKVSGGTIKANATYGRSIRNAGLESKITVSNGTIECGAEGIAIANAIEGANSEITVTGGTVSATGTNSTAIYNSSVYSSITVSGGNVESIYRGIYNNDENTNITITGGKVLAQKSYAISNSGTGTININGGIVFANGIDNTDVIRGNYTQNFYAVIVAWNAGSGTRAYTAGTSNDIYKRPTLATVVWAKQGSDNGILVEYNTTAGFIPIADVTVETTGIEQPRTTNCELLIIGDELRITSDKLQIGEIRIFNTVGQMIMSLPSPKSHETIINISHLSSGTYFLKMQTASGELLRKVIKK